MKCCNCGNEVPSDSVFCQYCGEQIVIDKQVDDSTQNAIQLLEEDNNTQVTINKTEPRRKETKLELKNSIKILVSSIIVILLLGNVGQLVFNAISSKKIKDLSNNESLLQESIIDINNEKTKLTEDLEDANKNKEALEKELNAAKNKYKKAEDSLKQKEEELKTKKTKADTYDLLLKMCNTSNIGYASERFHVDKGIVVLGEKEKNKKLNLIMNFSNSGNVTVTTNTSGDSASVVFDQSVWYGNSTTLTIVPAKKGLTAVTFTNSYNNLSFVVLIIVT